MKNFTSTKKTFTTLLAFLFLLASSEGQLAPNHDRINYTLFTKQYWTNADNDSATEDDITIKLSTYSSSNFEWSDQVCHHWQCDAECYSNENNWLTTVLDVSATSEQIDVQIQAWEEDGSSPCSYNQGTDDIYNTGFASESTLGDQYRYITFQKWPSQCSSNFGENGSEWLFNDINNYSYDVKIATLWRYVHGDSFDDPLMIQTTSSGQERTNRNSNLSYTTCYQDYWPNPLFFYGDDSDTPNPSNDVFYQFTTLDRSTVTVSTIHNNTDFDTFIQLMDDTGTLIEANDDYGGTTQSSVTQDLCAGTYYVMVEGYSENEGNFVLTISTTALSEISVTSVDIVDSDCQFDNGSITLGVLGGIAPYHFEWSNGSNLSTISNLSPGDYSVTVNDDCFENPYVATYTVESIDNEDPVITSCPDYTVYLQPNETFDANNIWIDYDDNCGVVSTDFSPNSFTYDDIGDHQITFTALDELGNIGTCNFTLSIKDGFTSATKDLAEAISLSLYPNPASTSIHIDYTHSSSEPWSLEIYDTTGKRITQMAAEGNVKITVTDWPEGLYFYRLIDENNTLKMTERFVVVH